MGLKDILERMAEKQKRRKALLTMVEEQQRVRKIVEDRGKSANERELERFMNEGREEMIKERLQLERNQRDYDIKFNHNALDVPNITKETDFQVLKQPNQFTNNGCMFTNQTSILKNNDDLFKSNNNMLHSNMNLVSGRCTL